MIAVITAGATVDAAFAEEIGTNVKALAPWGDMKLIDPALQAARACDVSRVVVIGNDAVKAHCGSRVDEVLPAIDDGRINLRKALTCAAPDEALLLLTSDMPFVTPEALQFFIAQADGSEIAMPLADGDAYEACYPNASAHVDTFGKERFAGGNAFYFSSGDVARRASELAMRLFQARKSLFEMARLFSDLPLLFRFATRTLTVSHLEAFAARRFALRVRAVRRASPGLCYDIDSPADFRYAIAHRESE